MNCHRRLGVCLLAFAVTSVCVAQPKKEDAPAVVAPKKDDAAPVVSKKDEIPQGFRAFIAFEPRFDAKDLRNRTGKMQDLVCDHGLNPVIAVFSRNIPTDANSPLSSIIAKQDELGELYTNRRLGSYVVFLSLKDEYRKDETRDLRKSEIDRFVKESAPKRTTIGLAEATETPDGTNQAAVPAQVTGLGIEAEDDVVILLYYRFTVIKRWKFKADAPPTAATLTELSAEVEKLLGKPLRRPSLEPKAESKTEPKAEPKAEPKEEPKN